MKISMNELTEYSTKALKKALDTNLSEYTETEIDLIRNEINQRPQESGIGQDTQNQTSSPHFFVRILPAIALIVLIYMSAAGQYLNIPETFDNAHILGLIDTIVITFILTFIPFILRIINKQAFEYKKGRIICITNSLVLFIVSIALQASIGFGFVGGLGAVIYYFVNMFLFAQPKTK